MKTLNVKMTACAFAAAALLAACGGGGTTPDTTAPTLAITDDISVTTATTAVTFTFTFSEAVGSSFVGEDIVVSGGTAGTLTKVSDTVYTLVVTPTDNSAGTINVSVAASAFTDIAGNNNTASVSASQAFDTTTSTPPVVNLLTNGDFENGSTGWSGNAANVVTEGGNSYNFADVTAAGNPWDVNLSRVVNIPTEGVRYKLSFTGSSNRTRALKAGIGLNQDPWTNTVQDITLTTTPQTFELTLTANFANASSRVIFDMGHDTGHVVIDNVVLDVIEEESPSTALTFASNYTDTPAPWKTTEGGDVGRYVADGALDWWSGLASSDATPNVYFGYGLLPTDWGFGAFVNAPNNGTANVSGYSNVRIAVWGNDQLVNQDPRPNFNLIMQAPAIGSCIPEVQREFQVTGSGAQTYTIPLSGMVVRQDCGQSSLNTAAGILATGVKSIHIQVTTANLNKTLGGEAGRYPNGLNVGPISFN